MTKSVVAEGAGYSHKAIDVTASAFRVRIAVVDAGLAQADQLARENSANDVLEFRKRPNQRFAHHIT